MSRTPSRSLDLEPIDRLEEKVKLLVAMIGQLKAEQARTAEETIRLRRDLDAARAQITDSETSLAEVTALRLERETIRGRVSDMLEQLEELHL
jgi:regulator of replication initiation timing